MGIQGIQIKRRINAVNRNVSQAFKQGAGHRSKKRLQMLPLSEPLSLLDRFNG
jgi:hypothetical protein